MDTNASYKFIHEHGLVNSTFDNEILALELAKFQLIHDHCVRYFKRIELCLLALGLFGNSLALLTLMRSKQMQTPSFVYHKALVSAYLIYCLNFLIMSCINAALTIPSQRQQLIYSNQIAAYYSAIANRVVNSVCGYLAMYTSLAISVDRFLALILLKHYSKFNRRVVAYFWIGLSLVLSAFIHSWAPWLENGVVPVTVDHANGTLVAYRQKDSYRRNRLKPYLTAKDWYNLTLRFAYAVLLIILTWTVICMFAKRMKKRRTLRSVSKRQAKRERSLFYLMVAVVIMAYIQVIPREGKRILELIYPTEYIGSNFANTDLPVQVRKSYMLFGLYAYTFTTPILNLCTIIERSLLFYFYFALNHSFREEMLAALHLKKTWHWVSKKLGFAKRRGRNRKGKGAGETQLEICTDGTSIIRNGTSRRGYGSNGSCRSEMSEKRKRRRFWIRESNWSVSGWSETSSKRPSIFSEVSTKS